MDFLSTTYSVVCIPENIPASTEPQLPKLRNVMLQQKTSKRVNGFKETLPQQNRAWPYLLFCLLNSVRILRFKKICKINSEKLFYQCSFSKNSFVIQFISNGFLVYE